MKFMLMVDSNMLKTLDMHHPNWYAKAELLKAQNFKTKLLFNILLKYVASKILIYPDNLKIAHIIRYYSDCIELQLYNMQFDKTLKLFLNYIFPVYFLFIFINFAVKTTRKWR